MIIKTVKSEIENYLSDEANYKGKCNKVFFPESVEEVKEIFKKANDDNTDITISGARTGLTGGCVPQKGIVISTEKLNEIIEINTEEKYAIVEAGVFLSDLQEELKNNNLFYAPNPTEINCTIGGTVATNASGGRTFKYRATRDFVESIEVVLPTGDCLTINRGEKFLKEYDGTIKLPSDRTIKIEAPSYKMPDTKHAAAFYCKADMDLLDLFIGSEGTLGFVAKVKLKLNLISENILSILIYFDNENDSFAFVNEVRVKSKDQNSIIDFRELEFIDNNSLDLIRSEFPTIPVNATSAIYIEQEYLNEIEDDLLGEVLETIENNNGDSESIWFAQSEKETQNIKAFRHAIPTKINEIIAKNNVTKVGTDTAVPHSKFSEFYFYTKELIKESNIQYVVFGHIGDSHVHFNMLPKEDVELQICKNIYRKICRKSVELGGTISAEHGIGKLKTQYLNEMFSEEEISQMVKLKKTFDPNLILNIGNIIEEKFLELKN